MHVPFKFLLLLPGLAPLMKMFQTAASVLCRYFESPVTLALDTLVPILLSACQMVQLPPSRYKF